ncbi:hypothetical protein DFH28DRAFT_888480 [Melampsora americana]|nr:hypothetical protein DFH28DRAFT_888480 [Melampsora americana]
MFKMILSLYLVTLLCIIPNTVLGRTVATVNDQQAVCQGTRKIGSIPTQGGAMTVTQSGSSDFQSGGDCYCLPVLGGDIYFTCTPGKWPVGTDVNSLILSCSIPGSTSC